MRLGQVVVLLLALGAAACGDAAGPTRAPNDDKGAIRARLEPRGSRAAEPGAWPTPNGDVANHRRVDGPIDAGTVESLRVAWKVPLASGYAATTIVRHGVVYAQDLGSSVYAIELASGRELWRKRFHRSVVGPNGVNVAGGRVFGATRTRAFALDASTGRQRWSRTLVRHPGDVIDMAPGYASDTVYVSTAVGGTGAVGTLWALDADTGAPRWRWETVPAGLWGDAKVNAGGGMWHPPAIDGDGALYASIANPLPFPGAAGRPWGSSRPGANRWTNSLVKLDARGGRLLWGRQVLPHDIHDWDLQLPPILDRVGGRLVVVTGGKMGIVYAFDAADGALLWKRSVGLHNGHDRDNLLAMRGAYRPRLPQKILPGWWGGVETQMASDGRTVYVPVNNMSIEYQSEIDYVSPDPTTGSGEVVAVDIATGDVRWDRRLPHSPYGAATISDDLVFTTTYDGTMWALRRSTGEVVWRLRLPAATSAPLSIAGDTLIVAAGVPEHSEPTQLIAYRLGGP